MFLNICLRKICAYCCCRSFVYSTFVADVFVTAVVRVVSTDVVQCVSADWAEVVPAAGNDFECDDMANVFVLDTNKVCCGFSFRLGLFCS